MKIEYMKKVFLIILLPVLILCSCKTDGGPFAPFVAEQNTITDAGPQSQTESESGIQSKNEMKSETENETVSEMTKTPGEDRIAELLASMTVEEKVGQMFFVRCPENGAVEDIAQYHLGGYLLFGRDFSWKYPKDVQEMTASYQAASKIPLFIGVDEEGGTVARISSNGYLWKYRFLSPQDIFRMGGMDGFAEDASEKAAMLKLYGINVNFAPVCDVSTDENDFIYRRSLGQDAAATSEFVDTVVGVTHDLGVASVLKHFPGYGNNVDTHTGIAVDNRPYTTFAESDFLPFLAGIDAGAEFVLVSHNIVACMDPDLPASISPGIHELLRRELGFDGIILTDDLAMQALDAYSEDNRSVIMAVKAGNDMIVTTDYDVHIPLVIEAVNSGEIDISVIDNAVYRILQIKYRLGLIS